MSSSPISVVRKKRAGAPNKRKKNRRPGRSSKKKRADRPMSVWQRNLLAMLMVFGLSVVFYYFFIRPYAYRWKPCYGRKIYGVCVPYGYNVHGVDISHYQGKIDWVKVLENQNTAAPLHFVFMKATEGGDHGDSTFAANFANARNYGLIRGAYHFYIPATDAVKQADFFIRTVRLEPGDLPPVLDVEVTGKKEKSELQQGIKRWLDRVEAHYGVKPILYTSYKFKKTLS